MTKLVKLLVLLSGNFPHFGFKVNILVLQVKLCQHRLQEQQQGCSGASPMLISRLKIHNIPQKKELIIESTYNIIIKHLIINNELQLKIYKNH